MGCRRGTMRAAARDSGAAAWQRQRARLEVTAAAGSSGASKRVVAASGKGEAVTLWLTASLISTEEEETRAATVARAWLGSECHWKMRQGAVNGSREGCKGGNGEALSTVVVARCKSPEKGGLDVLEPQDSRSIGVWGSLQWRLTTDAKEEGRNDG
ncbi:hypothetical protein BHM03_00034995 [Ensete ventricosum]|nr:hypothetical protein BHM03_00034995 [Ensete ventricosum]